MHLVMQFIDTPLSFSDRGVIVRVEPLSDWTIYQISYCQRIYVCDRLEVD